jgi:hypothetical protein
MQDGPKNCTAIFSVQDDLQLQPCYCCLRTYSNVGISARLKDLMQYYALNLPPLVTALQSLARTTS